jgi:YidC/Oxa1 family membrane protein insertase
MATILGPLIHIITTLLILLTGILHGYGLAIILATLGFRLLLTPFSLRQIWTQRKLASLAPQLTELQQAHAKDPAELIRAQRQLYRREGISLWTSILPSLVQAPILLALLFVVGNLAGAPLPGPYHQVFLWFRLDRPDHLFGWFGPLSLLPGALQWVQQRMMAAPPGDSLAHQTQLLLQLLPLAWY